MLDLSYIILPIHYSFLNTYKSVENVSGPTLGALIDEELASLMFL